MGYKSLNDVVARESTTVKRFARGDTEIWYMRPDWFREGINGTEPDYNHLDRTHILLGKINATDPEKIFTMLQGEYWSPEGEANELIVSKGIGHTSMSVGDIIKIGERVWLADFMGFKVRTTK